MDRMRTIEQLENLFVGALLFCGSLGYGIYRLESQVELCDRIPPTYSYATCYRDISATTLVLIAAGILSGAGIILAAYPYPFNHAWLNRIMTISGVMLFIHPLFTAGKFLQGVRFCNEIISLEERSTSASDIWPECINNQFYRVYYHIGLDILLLVIGLIALGVYLSRKGQSRVQTANYPDVRSG